MGGGVVTMNVKTKIKKYYRLIELESWVESKIIFGTTQHLTIEKTKARNIKVICLRTHGMVFCEHKGKNL